MSLVGASTSATSGSSNRTTARVPSAGSNRPATMSASTLGDERACVAAPRVQHAASDVHLQQRHRRGRLELDGDVAASPAGTMRSRNRSRAHPADGRHAPDGHRRGSPRRRTTRAPGGERRTSRPSLTTRQFDAGDDATRRRVRGAASVAESFAMCASSSRRWASSATNDHPYRRFKRWWTGCRNASPACSPIGGGSARIEELVRRAR